MNVIPKVLLAGAITLMDEGYFKLAVWLNDKGKTNYTSPNLYDEGFFYIIIYNSNYIEESYGVEKHI